MRIDRSAVVAAGVVVLLHAFALGLSLLLRTGAIPLCLLAVAVACWRYGTLGGLVCVPVSLVTVAAFSALAPPSALTIGPPLARLAVMLVCGLLLVWIFRTVQVALDRARMAEHRLAGILDSMKDAFLSLDVDWRITYINPAAAELAGHSPAELLGRSIWSLVPDYERTEGYQAFRRAASEKQPVHYETPFGPDRRWYVCDIYPAPYGLFAFARDITERKAAEETIREKEMQMRIITDSLPALISYADANVLYRFTNRAFQDWFGLAPEDFRGKPVAEFHGGEFERLRPHVDRVLQGDTVSYEGEFTFGGGKRFVHGTLVPDLDDSGKVRGYFSLTTDLSDRKAAEQMAETRAVLLRESERRFRAIFDQAAVGMAEIDLNGRFLQVNQKYCDIFGYTSQELKLLTLIDLALPEERLAEALQFGRMAAGQFWSYSGERRRVRKDGAIVWTNVAMSIVKDDVGKPLFAAAVVEEITDRKTLEEGLAQQARELARSNAELEQFAYAASHDLKEPLRTVGTHTDLILERCGGKMTDGERVYFDHIKDAVARMNALIQDLLTYSRVGQRDERPFGRVSLTSVVRWALMNLEHVIRSSGAGISFGDLPTVRGDETQLAQLFQNLLGNAIKYRGGDPPRIRLWAEQKEDLWLISVEDNGQGIEPQYHERIFGVFKRLHGREYPGTGIGLAISKKIVERHGGRIWVESQAGAGSTFRFTLPE